eukprot:1339927-Rhodomonas_salina.1
MPASPFVSTPKFVFVALVGLFVGTNADTFSIYSNRGGSTCKDSELVFSSSFGPGSCYQPFVGDLVWYKMSSDHCVDGESPKIDQFSSASCPAESQTGRLGVDDGTGCTGFQNADGQFVTFFKFSQCSRTKCTPCECRCGPDDEGGVVGTYVSLSPTGYCSPDLCKTKFAAQCANSTSVSSANYGPTKNCDGSSDDDEANLEDNNAANNAVPWLLLLGLLSLHAARS